MTTEYSGSGDVSRSLELLWGGRERPTRGPKPGLRLDKIVEAAVEIADAEGLEVLSMRRVAAKLGVGTMSLYRYVPGKSELLDLMLDYVSDPADDVPDEDAPPHWRPLLEEMARGIWKLCERHPWYPFVDQARPLLGPNALSGLEYIIRRLRTIGVPDQKLIMIIGLVSDFVTSMARTHLSAIQADQRTGVSADEFWAAQEPLLAKAMHSGRYPTLAALDNDTFAFSHEDHFEFGLARILDGIAVFIDGPAGAE
ncbi:TetR/AcrR family transcriptional regulator [Phytoactinopolyspora limicola]|uniref:TetR/AcrR family transcriptional regulator n=1 Tax=Phytoactinopolyspora limicola TaxID=2715536 RepID=UPI00140B7629|nr:TetR/AcrR family transcriptional regulator [Phytoactinopolyspora limicola]